MGYDSTTRQILEYIKEKHMFADGDTLCVGVSGGADSVFLLRLLAQIAAETAEKPAAKDSGVRVSLMAVHVNHMLRQQAADEDEAFVRALCKEQGVPLFVYRYAVAEVAAAQGIGTEEAGRLLRQEAYRDCVRQHGAQKIVLAHHANDLAETVLFHAARGSSVAGLAGIRPVQHVAGLQIVRPLLRVTRQEIEAWLRNRGYAWCSDATNETDCYTRNGIRHHVIPYLEREVNSQSVIHIAEAAGDLAEADAFLQEEAERRYPAYVSVQPEEDKARRTLDIREEIQKEPDILQGRILLQGLEQLAGRRKDLGRGQVRQLQELLRRQVGRQADLPYAMQAVRTYTGIRIRLTPVQENTAADAENIVAVVPGKETKNFFWGQWTFSCRILPAKSDEAGRFAVPEKQYTKWMDYDKIKHHLVLRSRRNGDFFVVNAAGGRQRLKAYLVNEKIPQENRDQIPLLASGDQIWWIVGGRISEAAKVTDNTKQILEITAKQP